MARKDISDIQVCRAVLDAEHFNVRQLDLLHWQTGECEKVCIRAMERAYGRGYLDYGVSIAAAWLTKKGERLVKSYEPYYTVIEYNRGLGFLMSTTCGHRHKTFDTALKCWKKMMDKSIFQPWVIIYVNRFGVSRIITENLEEVEPIRNGPSV